MSVCLCSFRALARSRTLNAKTLTPFLYQTATIQQRNPISRRNASNSSRPSKPDHDIPFEGEELPPAVDDAKASRKTTITGSERAAFEKLYKKFNNPEQEGWHDHELDQIADEYYEDDDDKPKDKSAESLDSIFDSVLSDKAPKSTLPSVLPWAQKKKKGTDISTLAKDILQPEVENEKKRKKKEASKQQARIKELRQTEMERIKALLEAAPTDQALWAVLEREVFSVIRNMHLDTQNGTGDSKSSPPSRGKLNKSPKSLSLGKKGGDLSPTDPTIIFPNYSYHLLITAHTLRANFPTSPLIFNILPTVKSLGRSSYALGATTPLYVAVMRAAFRQNHSYAQICSLLQDMDNGGIEYDHRVSSLLDEILTTHRQADKGHYGRGIQSVMRLELFDEGAQKLRAWRGAIAKRLGEFVEERKERGQLVRRVGRKSSEGGPVKGPRDEVQVLVGNKEAQKMGRMLMDGKRPEMNANDDIPLVEGDISPVEERAQDEAADETTSAPDVEGFVQDTIEAPVDEPVDTSIEPTVPPAEQQTPDSTKEAHDQNPDQTKPSHGQTVT